MNNFYRCILHFFCLGRMGGLFENTKGVPLPHFYTGLKDTPK
jgi:hypothetical protein